MITVKLHNWNKGRNEPTFRPFLFAQKLFNQVGIHFTTEDDYDFIFVGMADFINRKVSLQESIEAGLEAIESFGDKCFLFDGSDSTSLLGAYEVLSDPQKNNSTINLDLLDKEEQGAEVALAEVDSEDLVGFLQMI